MEHLTAAIDLIPKERLLLIEFLGHVRILFAYTG
jgi:hypothetical protein